MIMGDLSDTLSALLKEGGLDHGMLTENEHRDEDYSRLAYTDDDKKALLHFEAAATPAKRLCMFLQLKTNAWPYVRLELVLAVQNTAADTVATYSGDVSHMERTKDLRNRGEKTVLIKKSEASVSPDVARNYTRVEEMHSDVELYCDLYVKDLKERIGLDDVRPKNSLTFHCLLNPLFGRKKNMVVTGLLTEDQYEYGRNGELLCCQFCSCAAI